MKKLLLILCLIPVLAFGQRPNTYRIFADSVKLSTLDNSGNEFILENGTKDTVGVLANPAQGRTKFISYAALRNLIGAGTGSVTSVTYAKNAGGDSTIITVVNSGVTTRTPVLDRDGQLLSINVDTLFLSNGGYVIIPTNTPTDSTTYNVYDVISLTNTPPGSPSNGDIYLVGTAPTGAFATHANDIASRESGAWVYTDAVTGDYTITANNGYTYKFNGTSWIRTGAIPIIHNGQNISGGIRVGTNNNTPTTFETNNTIRQTISGTGVVTFSSLTSSDDALVYANASGVIETVAASLPFHLLKSLMTNDSLILGASYLHNNFTSIYDQPDYDNTGTAKGTVVTKTASTEYLVFHATSDSTFASEVSSLNYPTDKLEFDWNFTSTEVMAAAAKGRISRRVDANGNKADYDFRKVLFKRYRDGANGYSSWKDNDSTSSEFLTFSGAVAINNNLYDFYETSIAASLPFRLSNNVFHDVALGNDLKNYARSNTFMAMTVGNILGDEGANNTFLGQTLYNVFLGDHTIGNTFAGACGWNNIWGAMLDCTAGEDFSYNVQYGKLTNAVIGDRYGYGYFTGETLNYIAGDDNQYITIVEGTDVTIGNSNEYCKLVDRTSFTLGSSILWFNDENANVDLDNTATQVHAIGADGQDVKRDVASIGGSNISNSNLTANGNYTLDGDSTTLDIIKYNYVNITTEKLDAGGTALTLQGTNAVAGGGDGINLYGFSDDGVALNIFGSSASGTDIIIQPANGTMQIGSLPTNNAATQVLGNIGSGTVAWVDVQRVLEDFFADANNTGTGETDLYSYTSPVNTLTNNGDKITATYSGTFNDLTATSQLKLYFGGVLIANTGELTVSATGGWKADLLLIRSNTTTARSVVNISTPGASTAIYTTETDLTGLDFTATNIIKITGQAGGASGGNSDITGKLGTISFTPKAN